MNLTSASVSPTFAEYAAQLREHVPSLFEAKPDADPNARRLVITEYGRSACGKAGWAASVVEYVKPLPGGDRVAVLQAGADLFMRTCYCPKSFPMRLTGHSRSSAICGHRPPWL